MAAMADLLAWRPGKSGPRLRAETLTKARRVLPPPLGFNQLGPVFTLTPSGVVVPPRPDAGPDGFRRPEACPDVTERVDSFVDKVHADEASRRIRIVGWAVRANAPLFDAVPEVALVTAGGDTYFLPTTRLGRPDLSAVYGAPWAHNSGFLVDEVLDDIPGGEYRIGIRLTSPDPLTAIRLARRQLKGDEGTLLSTRRVVRDRGELDREVAEMTAAKERSLLEWMAYGASFQYHEDVASLPADPLSPEYRQTQLDLFYDLSGRSSFDPFETEGRPVEDVPPEAIANVESFAYPYRTRAPEHIGNHYLAMGHILRVFGEILPVGSSILEYGSGEGFSTVALASSGYRVTAVDIDAYAVAIVDLLAKNRDVEIRPARGEFGALPDGERQYDAVFFYEAFHHCLDFIELLDLIERTVRPGGYLVLAGEPILADFPKPWGLRLDGGAVWEICTNGWLELGFNEAFFTGLLERRGWQLSWHELDRCPKVLVGKRIGQG